MKAIVLILSLVSLFGCSQNRPAASNANVGAVLAVQNYRQNVRSMNDQWVKTYRDLSHQIIDKDYDAAVEAINQGLSAATVNGNVPTTAVTKAIEQKSQVDTKRLQLYTEVETKIIHLRQLQSTADQDPQNALILMGAVQRSLQDSSTGRIDFNQFVTETTDDLILVLQKLASKQKKESK